MDYLERFRRRAPRPPSVDLWLEVARPEPIHAKTLYLPPDLHDQGWQYWLERERIELIGLAREQIGRLILRAPHPCPPGRIPWSSWSSLPEHLAATLLSLRDLAVWPAEKWAWYIGTPLVDTRIEELEAEILPIALAAGCREFILDALPLQGELLATYAKLATWYGLDFSVEPFPLQVDDDTDRERLAHVPTLCTSERWAHAARRISLGAIPRLGDEDDLTVVWCKSGGRDGSARAQWLLGEMLQAKSMGVRHLAVNARWYVADARIQEIVAVLAETT